MVSIEDSLAPQMSRCEKEIHLLMKGVMSYKFPLTDPSVFSLQGYFLLFESMLDTVLFARDKWLKSEGCGKILLHFERVCKCRSN